MTRPLRSLQTSSDSSTPPSLQQQPAAMVDSDVVVILASLLCALICVLGLIVAARCAWLRRLSFRAVPPPVSASPQNSVANKGLKKKILKSLPRETYTDNLSAKFTDCAICLTEFTSGDEIRALPQCGHSFHVSCIDTWLGSHSSCPSCRQILVVARCQKCGGLPPHAVPSTATVSPSPAGAEPDTSPKEREADDANRFLP